MSNQLLNKDQISNMKPGWSHPVLPGHAVQGSILLTRSDFVNPPQSSEMFIWKPMEDILGVHDMKLEYNAETNMYELMKSYGHLNNDGTWIEDWYKIGAWATISEELEEALKKLTYFEYKFDASANSLVVTGVQENQVEVMLATITFVSPQEFQSFIEDIDSRLAQEITRATVKEADLEESIEEEVTRASNKENQIVQNLNNEITRATNKEGILEASIQTEVTRATTKEQDLQDQINDNKENLANYVGNFATKADLDAYSGEVNNNDYAVVAADETHSGQCWRYIYRQSASTWLPQYMVNEEPFTQAQLDALNSGINTAKVAQIEQNRLDIANINTEIGELQHELTPGDGINIASNVVSVKSSDGITVDATGVKANLDQGLEIHSAKIRAKIGNGIMFDANNGIKVKSGNGIDVNSNGVNVSYNSTNLKMNGTQLDTVLQIWLGTEAEYTALGTYDSNTLYLCKEE